MEECMMDCKRLGGGLFCCKTDGLQMVCYSSRRNDEEEDDMASIQIIANGQN
jgi:hypothetical protein